MIRVILLPKTQVKSERSRSFFCVCVGEVKYLLYTCRYTTARRRVAFGLHPGCIRVAALSDPLRLNACSAGSRSTT